MKIRLLHKLLAINLGIIILVILLVWIAMDYLAADYFSVLMNKYHISPTETHSMFVDSVHRYLISASVISILVAIALSYLLTHLVLRPLTEMNNVIHRLADNDYSTRVQTVANDEIGQLGNAFNHLADILEQVEQLRRNMVADVAHELRTPLTNIRGYLEALQDSVVTATPEAYQLLQQEVYHLIKLVEDLERLQRADSAKGHLFKSDIPISQALDQVTMLYRPQFQKNSISFEQKIDTSITNIYADRDKLQQIIGNLMQNASRYTPMGGRVSIEADTSANGVHFRFTNSGQPLPEDNLPLIFERFFRDDQSRSRDSGGAGLGLAIVKQLVEAHGGTVSAKNTRAGICIGFNLPQ